MFPLLIVSILICRFGARFTLSEMSTVYSLSRDLSSYAPSFKNTIGHSTAVTEPLLQLGSPIFLNESLGPMEAQQIAKDNIDNGTSTPEAQGTRMSTRGESSYLKGTYEEWLEVMFEEMYGHQWVVTPAEKRQIRMCRDNFSLKNKGCQIFTHTCYEAFKGHWTCQSAFSPSCYCGGPTEKKGFFSWLIPDVRKCYGKSLSDAELREELGKPEDMEEIFETDEVHFALGECRVSGIFLMWLTLPLILLATSLRCSYRLFRKFDSKQRYMTSKAVFPQKKSATFSEASKGDASPRFKSLPPRQKSHSVSVSDGQNLKPAEPRT